MARGVYEAGIKISALTTGRTLMYITAPASACVEIRTADVTDANNSTNQQLECCWQKITTLGTPTSTPITPTKTEQGDQAAASTVAGNVTASEPTYTSGPVFDQRGFPSLVGYKHAPDESERLVIKPGDTWGLRLLTTSPSSQDTDVLARFREIG